MACESDSPVKFAKYYNLAEFHYIAKFYRHPVFFLQVHGFRPWIEEERGESFKRVRGMLQGDHPKENVTGDDVVWFEELLKTKVEISWGEIWEYGEV